MDKVQLAIASIPTQSRGAVYEDGKALKTGTLFQDLDMPFFAAIPDKEEVSGPKGLNDREQLLQKINEVSFVINDLTLYLDMHSKNQEAMSLLQEHIRQRKTLLEQFAREQYPLTRDCAEYYPNGYGWNNGPMPWEGACV